MSEKYQANFPAKPETRTIDYERMRKEWPKQKKALKAAAATKDPVKVAEVCAEAVRVWDEIGCWPDDWALFERTLGDLLPWHSQVTLDDLAYNGVTITRAEVSE